MVSFRFYVVATVALFLALAIGIVIGSALNETIVSSLKESTARVEANLDESVAAMEKRKREIDQLDRFIDGVAPYAVDGRLADTTALVIADPAASEAQVDELVSLLQTADSDVDGVAWLTEKWALEKPSDRRLLSEITATPDSGAPAARRAAGWGAVLDQILGATPAEGASGADPAVTTTSVASPPTTVADLLELSILAELRDGGFVKLDQGDSAAGGPRGEVLLVVVTAAESQLGDAGGVAVEAATAAREAGVPTVVAESYDPADKLGDRATTLTTLRDSSPEGISTVDDLDLVAGRVGTVLALVDLMSGRSGHYGYGPGADRVLPEWAAN